MKGGIFSPENFPLKYHFTKLSEKIIGKRFWGQNRMNEIEKNQAKEYVNNNIFFIRPDDENFSIDVILEKARLLVKKYGIKYLIIDPFNRLEHQMEKGMSETNYVSNLLDKIITFKQKYNCLVFLIAHPRKINKNKTDGMYEVPNLYDISGSSNFFNKADIGLTVYRNFTSKLTELYVQKVRFKHWGQQGVVSFNWNESNGRYTNDTSNWLVKTEPAYNPSLDPNRTIEPNRDFENETELIDDPFN
jgi:twinkle protein